MPKYKIVIKIKCNQAHPLKLLFLAERRILREPVTQRKKRAVPELSAELHRGDYQCVPDLCFCLRRIPFGSSQSRGPRRKVGRFRSAGGFREVPVISNEDWRGGYRFGVSSPRAAWGRCRGPRSSWRASTGC